MDRRMLVAGGGMALGLGLWRARGIAAEPADFGLSGALSQGGWARGIAPIGVSALSLSGNPVDVARDGRFFIAFDRDSAPSLELSARLADGRQLSRLVQVAPRAWQIERIPIGPKPGTPPAKPMHGCAAGNSTRSTPRGMSTTRSKVGGRSSSGRSMAGFRAGSARSGFIMACPAATTRGSTLRPAPAAHRSSPPPTES